MIILGLETSCDETAAAIIRISPEEEIEILSNVVSSQIELHAAWGGVVPNLAAREHLKNILPVIETSLKEANLSPKDIDLLAVTEGPGLIPALLIGTNTARTLSYVWQVPLMGIHHIEGHIYANFINRETHNMKRETIHHSKDDSRFTLHASQFPVLCLVVSGGHTQLVLMRDHLDYEIIGETLDDAAGEAFDKVARILGLGYPGGPAIAQEAEKVLDNNYQLLSTKLPRPMLNSPDFNFSFSGLKTAVLYLVKKNEALLKKKEFINEVSSEFQQATIDVLITKTILAAKKYQPKTIMLAGGVSANKELRRQLGEAIQSDLPDTKYKIPDTQYSIDNAAMIASAAWFRWKKLSEKGKAQLMNTWKDLQTNANLKLK